MADTAPKVAEKERREAPESVETKARQLADRIRKSKHFIAFTGAGISTSAGQSMSEMMLWWDEILQTSSNERAIQEYRTSEVLRARGRSELKGDNGSGRRRVHCKLSRRPLIWLWLSCRTAGC